MKGEVVFFNAAKGWGFIHIDGSNDDLFVHYSAIQAEGYKKLNPGQRVEFDTVQGPKGPQADNVRVIE
jgi:CspA family cold shock protein